MAAVKLSWQIWTSSINGSATSWDFCHWPECPSCPWRLTKTSRQHQPGDMMLLVVFQVLGNVTSAFLTGGAGLWLGPGFQVSHTFLSLGGVRVKGLDLDQTWNNYKHQQNLIFHVDRHSASANIIVSHSYTPSLARCPSAPQCSTALCRFKLMLHSTTETCAINIGCYRGASAFCPALIGSPTTSILDFNKKHIPYCIWIIYDRK